MSNGARHKHSCPDCRMCQQCAESRCRVCRGEKNHADQAEYAHMSMADQIRLFETINSGSRGCMDSGPAGDSSPGDKNNV